MGNFINSTDIKDIDEVFNLMKTIMHNGCHLTKHTIDDSEANLFAMNSNDTYIVNKEIEIIFQPWKLTRGIGEAFINAKSKRQ